MTRSAAEERLISGLEAELAAALRRCTQLEGALHSRIVIEQAKGMLSERYGIGVETAFEVMRRAARDGRRDIHELAASVVAGDRGPESPPDRERT